MTRTHDRPSDTRLIAFTDGACDPNPGVGGWGYLIIDTQDDAREYKYGGVRQATNNRMELTAVAEALEGAWDDEITIITDSQLIVKTFTQWINGWKRRGWRKFDGGEIKNLDLVQRIHRAQLEMTVTFQWIRGHSGKSGNEQADRLAALGRRELLMLKVDEHSSVLDDHVQFRDMVKQELERMYGCDARKASI